MSEHIPQTQKLLPHDSTRLDVSLACKLNHPHPCAEKGPQMKTQLIWPGPTRRDGFSQHDEGPLGSFYVPSVLILLAEQPLIAALPRRQLPSKCWLSSGHHKRLIWHTCSKRNTSPLLTLYAVFWACEFLESQICTSASSSASAQSNSTRYPCGVPGYLHGATHTL